ncbi:MULTISPECIES: tRNA (N6-isopentenyl adenosine(37)-C2)-methylthiotransferase MiaB [unclassified Spirosoma]|uniref:tRNA (N6-isopentenyl adenosine(37)-C2)-methylthiotransferase MiaB n=1 Tax=unclassified Spirosoma TaxID=2621999 RepID=UPI0009682CA3|nr:MULTISPECIES: tRNA (N6-isopentenyl adenosine(37)-C2)-methylthiotransferase MiaB [unclassified Spirosoma]MBN8821235.1 tRNA (N6-isopentenyl adenosine(37)-C2)-methylthiotransferase MiaB [Spirosoma sp.]OJW79139.1 MAG: tRNA (N6-isopentenyl adenosine(37)-C2)-methylthiotransferase MiaB [Spirosoma sp. 48-14]
MTPITELTILQPADKEQIDLPRTSEEELAVGKKRLYIESYGCQMNFADSEIVAAVMRNAGFATTSSAEEADLIFLNTCAIRDNAEQKVRNRLKHLTGLKRQKPELLVGMLGCMAERLKTKLLEEEKVVDIVAGPDAYRDIPKLVEEAESGQKAVNVFLSREETYADISPIRLNSNGVTAFVSIMRGCDNMCSFCVVPFTRGRERSRDPHSIVREAQELFDQGYREVTLLGQNVDSYKWQGAGSEEPVAANAMPQAPSLQPLVTFANLLEMVAQIHPDLRVRFSTSHPKDITDDVLHTMARYENICKYIHLPAQSGNSRVLRLMNRTYDRPWYIGKIDRIREILGEDCGISTDMISGFCTETEEEHQESLSLMDYVRYDYAYMFAYSERPGTLAAKKYTDDIPEEVKKRRLNEIIARQLEHSAERNQRHIGQVQRVLIEGPSKRSDEFLCGRNDQNKMVVFPKGDHQKGQYVNVLVTECTSATLIGQVVSH